MKIFELILTIMSVVVLFGSFYFLALIVGAFFFKKRTCSYSNPIAMAIVINAHNAEKTIENTISHIRKSNYPKDKYMICVIADRCTDGTVEIAKKCSEMVLEINEHNALGHPMEWFVREHIEKFLKFQAIIYIKDNTIVDKKFLWEISASFSYPQTQIVQAHCDVFNPEQDSKKTLVSVIRYVNYYFKRIGQMTLFSTVLIGKNGIAFNIEVLQKFGFSASSDYTLRLLLNDTPIQYNPDAIVFEQGDHVFKTEKVSFKGKLKLLNQFWLPFIEAFWKKGELCYLGALCELMAPPLLLLLLIQTFMFLCSFVVFQSSILLYFICIIISFLYICSALNLKDAHIYEWLAILKSPVSFLKQLY